MEKINITHFYFMDEGKRIEETVEAIDLGNDCVLTMTGIYSIYDGPRGPEIGYHSEISENVMCSTPKNGRIPVRRDRSHVRGRAYVVHGR